MVKLLQGVTHRKKVQNLYIRIEEDNKKGIAFFERFGFAKSDDTINKKNQKNKPKNGTKEEKKQDSDIGNCVTLKFDVKLYRQSVMVLVRKQMKEEEESKNNNKNNDSNTDK